MANYIVNPNGFEVWSDAAKQQIPPLGYISVALAVYNAQSTAGNLILTTVTPTAPYSLAATHVTDGTVNDVGRHGPAESWKQ